MDHKPTVDEEYVSSTVKEQLEDASNDRDNASGPPKKKIKLKGRNKHRPKGRRIDTGDKLCPSYIHEQECFYGNKCKFSHDKEKFLASKLPDIGEKCYIYETYGKCSYGIACRFAKSHLTSDLKNMTNKDIIDKVNREKVVSNVLSKELKMIFRKRTYDYGKADRVLAKICPKAKDQKRFGPKIDKNSELKSPLNTDTPKESVQNIGNTNSSATEMQDCSTGRSENKVKVDNDISTAFESAESENLNTGDTDKSVVSLGVSPTENLGEERNSIADGAGNLMKTDWTMADVAFPEKKKVSTVNFV